jgi:hypothetical protein
LDALAKLQNLVEESGADGSLAESDRFRDRIEALDRLDAYDLDLHFSSARTDKGEAELYRRAIALRTKLEAGNFRLYENIRDSIRRGAGGKVLLRYAAEASAETAQRRNTSDDGDSYDYLDDLISGVLRFAVDDTPKADLSSEMVAYQPTPARHVFEMICLTKLVAEDLFIDLGSGLGHVPLLIATCTDARAIGIELEPSYVQCARRCAAELNATRATFLAQDAREAHLSSGTVFYLYTPFRGAILRTVLDRLRAEANTREIRVCTFGPCTPTVAAESWLSRDMAESGHISVFRSRK